VAFKMETRRVMRIHDVLFLPRLIYSVIYVLVIERKGFEVLLQDVKSRFMPRGSKSNGIVLGVEIMVSTS